MTVSTVPTHHAWICTTEPSQHLERSQQEPKPLMGSRGSLLSSQDPDRAAAPSLLLKTCPLLPADVVPAPAQHHRGGRAVQRGEISHPAPGAAPLEPAVLDTAKQMWIRTAPNPAFTGTQPLCLFSILKAELITIFVSILISHVHIKAQLMFSLTSQAAVWMPKISKLSWRETRIKEKNNLDKRAVDSEMLHVAHFPILRETY